MPSRRSLDYAKDVAPALDDGRLDAPAFHRNKDAIFAVLRDHTRLQPMHFLEVASGTGQHAAYFAERWPEVTWWPTDFNPGHLGSIDAWTRHAGVTNVKPASIVDVTTPSWPSSQPHDDWPASFGAIIAANMIHIAPWAATIGLIEGAARRLTQAGMLFIYGPFRRGGKHSAPSNEAFDESLKSRDPSWGVRELSDIERLAAANGLALTDEIEMPANNLTLVLRRADGPLDHV